MDSIALGHSTQTVKIKSWHIQIPQRFGLIQSLQTAQAASLQIGSYATAASSFNQLHKALVPEALDHIANVAFCVTLSTVGIFTPVMIAKRVLQMFLITGMLIATASTELRAQDSLSELEPGVVPDAVIRADFSGNSIVGFEDFFQYVGAFGVAGTDAERFDLNGNGRVDFDDLFLFADSFGRFIEADIATIEITTPARTTRTRRYPRSVLHRLLRGCQRPVFGFPAGAILARPQGRRWVRLLERMDRRPVSAGFRRPSCGWGVVGRCAGLLRLAWRSIAYGGGVGESSPRQGRPPLPVGRRVCGGRCQYRRGRRRLFAHRAGGKF